jgi:hypothetical protein
MKIFIVIFSVLLLSLISCKGEGEKGTEKTFVSDTIQMPLEFSPFNDDNIPKILEEANLCKDIPKDSLSKEINMFDPPCMANFYRVFKINESKEMNQVMGVVIASGVHDFPLRRTLLLVKEGGKWVMMNRFVGDVVEMRTTPSGYHDLLIRHRDNEAGSFAVKYVYKEGKYHPELAEEAGDARIKKEYIDSLTPLIIDRITDKKMYQ